MLHLFALAMASVAPAAEAEAINLAIQPYCLCLGTYVSKRMPDDGNVLTTYALATQAVEDCKTIRADVSSAANAKLLSLGFDDAADRNHRVSLALCKVDFLWGWRPKTLPPRAAHSVAEAPQYSPDHSYECETWLKNNAQN